MSRRADQLLSVLSQQLSDKEPEAIQFLLAYMPRSDLAEYNGEFFLASARTYEENTIRESYKNSWMKSGDASQLALRTGTYVTRVGDIIRRSMENYSAIAGFIEDAPDD